MVEGQHDVMLRSKEEEAADEAHDIRVPGGPGLPNLSDGEIVGVKDNVMIAPSGTPKEDGRKDRQQLQHVNRFGAQMRRQSRREPAIPIQPTNGNQRSIREQMQRR